MITTIKVGYLIYDGLLGLDLFGSSDVFHQVNEFHENSYEIILISEHGQAISTESKIKIQADYDFNWQGVLDTLIIPGGKGARRLFTNKTYQNWILKRAKSTRRIISICSGSYLLAGSGLLDGRRACTHWSLADDFQSKFPAVNLDAQRLFIKEHPIYTSAGVSSGIDLTLSLVADDFDKTVAIKVARYLVVYYRRAGHQTQFSEPLQTQADLDDKFESLHHWLLENINSRLSIPSIAKRFHMSERSFQRKFREQFQLSPGQYILKLRMERAQILLTTTKKSIVAVAELCGFTHVDVFRRAFAKHAGITPKHYRYIFSDEEKSSLLV